MVIIPTGTMRSTAEHCGTEESDDLEILVSKDSLAAPRNDDPLPGQKIFPLFSSFDR
jgi:hypothetical protein